MGLHRFHSSGAATTVSTLVVGILAGSRSPTLNPKVCLGCFLLVDLEHRKLMKPLHAGTNTIALKSCQTP